MEISFRCPSCRVKLGVEVKYAGRSMYCPKCEGKITIPNAGLGTWTTLGEYRLKKVVGKGTSGEVYLAQDRNMEKEVAVKVFKRELTGNPVFLKKFLHEINIIARLAHPNIVTAFKAGEDHQYHYLVMEYISGGTLEDRIIRHGLMDEKDALKITLLVAQALDYAWHKEGILHLDLKPENLMLDQNGRVKITDLGIARCLKDFDYEVNHEITGTPAFMSPEQASGNQSLDMRSDLFSLGGTLYFMLTGEMPFGVANVKETLERVKSQTLINPQKYNDAISHNTVEIIDKMMAKDRNQRHQNWSELIQDLKEELKSEPHDKKIVIRKHSTEPRIHLNSSKQKNDSN